jgi:hypothetical protein
MYYILMNKKPVPVSDIVRWAQWFGTNSRHVKDTTIEGVRVSTVFLGIDHSFNNSRKPILFETMIFGGEHDGYQDRCSTWDEAVVNHEKAIEMLFEVKYDKV